VGVKYCIEIARNLSIGRYSDDVKVCIGFYLDSYSLQRLECTAGLTVATILCVLYFKDISVLTV
jgi:hypothetical protein